MTDHSYLAAVRPYHDNVLIRMDPRPAVTASGIHVVQRTTGAQEHRTAVVVAVGPGRRGIPCWSHPEGLLIPPQVREGDRVVVDARAGQVWDRRYDQSVPRHNGDKGVLADGEYRMVRESGEILGVLEDG